MSFVVMNVVYLTLGGRSPTAVRQRPVRPARNCRGEFFQPQRCNFQVRYGSRKKALNRSL
jgi:hypothetical protein